MIESKNSAYPVGSYIYGHFGWRTHTLVADLDDAAVHPIRPYPCPDTGAHPRSYALGCMGRVGNSAYFGLFELCQPKAGETVVVSGAAGAVGSLVGQLAKAKGCRVIGIAGGAEKCDWLRNELGFDATVDYKAASDGGGLATALELAAPDGVDCYFDNVGGLISYAVTMRMNQRGRIAVCGSISAYNLKTGEVLRGFGYTYIKIHIARLIVNIFPPATVPPVLDFHRRLLRMEGFQVNRWLGARWFEGINYIKKCLDEGTVKHTETVTQGFDQMPSAFIALFNGGNVGKAIVKV